MRLIHVHQRTTIVSHILPMAVCLREVEQVIWSELVVGLSQVVTRLFRNRLLHREKLGT